MANELITLATLDPKSIYMTDEGADAIIGTVKATAKAFLPAPDVTTNEGRKQIASVAYMVAKTKTGLDDMGKALTEDVKKQVAAIDAKRRLIRDELDALKDDIRAPLTEFEQREKCRIADHEAALSAMSALSGAWASQDEIKKRINALAQIFARDWQEYAAKATAIHDSKNSELSKALDDRIKYDDQQAEMVRLRKEEEERKAKEREEQIAREAADRAKRQAEAEAEAKLEAERKAALAAQQEIERKHQAELQKQHEEIERARREAEIAAQERKKAEDDKIASKKAAKADEEKRRENTEHQAFVSHQAISDLAENVTGVDMTIAARIVSAIAQNKIRNVTINF